MIKILLIVTVMWTPHGEVARETKDLKFGAPYSFSNPDSDWDHREQCVQYWNETMKPVFEKEKVKAETLGMLYHFRAKCIGEVQ